MDQIIQQVGRIFARIDVPALVDILILAFLIYGLLSILRGTRAEVLVRGMIILFGLAFVIVTIWPLTVLKWLVTNSLQFIIFAIVVIFAPEMRRALEQIGHTSDFINRPLTNRSQDAIRVMIEEVIAAASYLSSQRWGGLIVIERETGLQDLANRGVPVGAQVSSQLLGNLFVPSTPLHDGAVIIRQDQIVAAKVILPLSESVSRYEQYGTRHKAALGISEQSDAIIVVVSEETGSISVAYNGKLHTKLDRDRLRQILRSLLEPGLSRANTLRGRSASRKPTSPSAVRARKEKILDNKDKPTEKEKENGLGKEPAVQADKR